MLSICLNARARLRCLDKNVVSHGAMRARLRPRWQRSFAAGQKGRSNKAGTGKEYLCHTEWSRHFARCATLVRLGGMLTYEATAAAAVIDHAIVFVARCKTSNNASAEKGFSTKAVHSTLA